MASKTTHLLLLSERLELLEKAYNAPNAIPFSITVAESIPHFLKLSQRFDFQGYVIEHEYAKEKCWSLLEEIHRQHPTAFAIVLNTDSTEEGVKRLLRGSPGLATLYPPFSLDSFQPFFDELKKLPLLFYENTTAENQENAQIFKKSIQGAKIKTLKKLEEASELLQKDPSMILIAHLSKTDASFSTFLKDLSKFQPRAKILLVLDSSLSGTTQSLFTSGGWTLFPYPHNIPFLLEQMQKQEQKPTTQTKEKERILVVDDEPNLLEFMVDMLTESEEGYEVDGCLSGEEALEALKKKQYHLALLDYKLEDTTGLILAKEIHKIDEDLTMLLMTAHASLDMAVKAFQADIYDYLIKPVQIDRLTSALKKALEKRRMAMEIKSLVADLTKANKQLNQLNEIKSRFLSIVSHDLRTPLTSIKGYAQVLNLQDDLPDDQKQSFLSIIVKEADHLGGLINDLMDFVSIEAGKLRVEKSINSLETLIEGVYSRMTPISEEKKITLKTNIKSPKLPKVEIDTRRIDQVLTNFVGNAFKHTPENGTVTIEADIQGEFVRLQIIDSGEGIPPEDLPKIFGQFYQVETHQSKKEGIGLGLTICQEIIQAHGGEIGANSEGKGKGSQFWFTIPIPQ